MRLREVMTHEVEVIQPDASLDTAAQKMRMFNISALPVCDGQQLVGIITERDLMRRGTAEARASQTATVREVMTTDLLSCFEDQESAEALQLMQERQVRHLAVLSRNRRLVGILSLRDLAAPHHEAELAGSAIRWPA